jgi:hypothetical protein
MHRRGVGYFEVFLAVVFIAIVIMTVHTAVTSDRELSRRSQCASNLRQIGLGLMDYAQANNDKFPAIPADPSARILGTDVNQEKAVNEGQSPWRDLSKDGVDDPFAKDSKGKYRGPVTTPTVSASLWLLCRKNLVDPKVFICPGEQRKINIGSQCEESRKKFDLFSDFYTDPSAGGLISYSFISPYSANWNTAVKPQYIIGGDENNGENPAYAPGENRAPDRLLNPTELQETNWDKANSQNHEGRGQNYLVIDASVNFSKNPYAGSNEDNIYTAMPKTFKDSASCVPGVLRVRPTNKMDTVLIPNRASILEKWNQLP